MHHPPPGASAQAAQGMSPVTWLLIIAGLAVAVSVVYYFFKSK